MRKLLRNLRGLLVFSGLTLNTILCFVPIFVLAIFKLLLPLATFRRVLTRWLMAITELWIGINRRLLVRAGSRDWELTGDLDLRRDGWYLVVANHQSWVDIIVLQSTFNRRIPLLKFFIKQELVWVPFLGIAWWALDMPFMKRYSQSYLARHPEKRGRDLEATRRACEKFRRTPTSVINFVEGSRFSDEKRLARQSPYRHLLPPRAGGVAVALSSMGELFDALLDVTIVYAGGPPRFWDMCCGDRVDVCIDVEQRQLSPDLVGGDYGGDRDYRRRVHSWLTELWAAKDERIARLSDDSQLDARVA